MTVLDAVHWLSSCGATLSLIGAQSGRIHVYGPAMPDPVAEVLSRHRELISLLLVLEYDWTGKTEVEAVHLHARLDSLAAWLRSLPPRTSLTRTEVNPSMQTMALAMLQDLDVDACDASRLARLLDSETARRSAA